MLLYYTSKIRNNKIKNIIDEATNKYINNIKEKIYLNRNQFEIIDNNDNNDNNNYGLLVFISFISFLSGFSFGRKSIL